MEQSCVSLYDSLAEGFNVLMTFLQGCVISSTSAEERGSELLKTYLVSPSYQMSFHSNLFHATNEIEKHDVIELLIGFHDGLHGKNIMRNDPLQRTRAEEQKSFKALTTKQAAL